MDETGKFKLSISGKNFNDKETVWEKTYDLAKKWKYKYKQHIIIKMTDTSIEIEHISIQTKNISITMKISEKIKSIHKEVTLWRQKLHSNPELAYEEKWTSNFII